MISPKTYDESRQWFIDRIGKRIFREMTTCTCETCCEVFINGLVVSDADHAYYLSDVSREFPLRYADTKDEIQSLPTKP